MSGVTNPAYANETNFFKVESFQQSGGDYIPLESSDAFITYTPSPGALSGESMVLADTEVGAYSTLTLDMTVKNSIPQDGHIKIYFPKWNPFATSTNQMESYISTSTSPGSVQCSETLYFSTTQSLDCTFTHYSTFDVL